MNKPVLIAGKSAGHPVRCNSDISGIFSELERLSRDKKNYWALRAVQELKSLAAGHDKPNVFVSSAVAGVSRREIMMVLPGCVARIVKTSKGEYLIYGLEADTAYDRLQKKKQATRALQSSLR